MQVKKVSTDDSDVKTLPTLSVEEMNRQKKGWISLVFFLFFFPLFFFVCVYFPMWIGWTPRFP